MITDLGTVRPGETLYVPFHTFDSNDPAASVTITGLAVGDIEIYKDGGTTQRASTNGYTLLDTDGIDFDGTTGIHGASIDLADNSTANFYEAGSRYFVVIASITVDAATINFVPCMFRIGYQGAILDTTLASLASQVSFTLEDGSTDNDAYNGCVAVIHDLASAVQVAIGYVSDYVGSTRTVTLAADPGIFTMAVGDNFSLFPPANLMAVAGTAQTAGDIVSDTEAVLADTEAAVPVLTDTEAILTDAEAIVADTNELQTDWANGGRLDVILDAVLTDTEAAGPVLTDTEAILTDSEAIVADTNELQTDWANGGRLDVILDAALADTEVILVDTEAILSDTEGLSAGSGLTPLASGTAQGGTASTIQLAAGETFANDELNGNVVKITSGAGAGQARVILDYTGSTDTATVTPNWITNPTATSVYEVVEGSGNLVAVGLTAQTAGDIIADTEATLADTETVLTDTEAILADSEAIVADTNELQGDWANGGRLDLILDATLADTEAAAPVLTDTEAILGDTEAIVADTNELQTDWANGGRLDLIVDGILADTEAATGVITDTEAILSDTEATVADTNELQGDWANGGRLDLLLDAAITDTEAILVDTEAAAPVLTDTEAILADTEAATGVLTDTEAILTDTEAVLADTESMEAGIVTGAFEGTPTTTVMQTDLAEATDDHYNGAVLIITSGAGIDQRTDITDYAGATGTLTVTAVATAPAATDTFKIV